MTDVTQALLIAVITVLTVVLTIIGIQVIHILKEFRKTVENINKILADAGKVSGEVSNSVAEIAGITSGVRSVLGIFNLFSKRKGKEEKEDG